MSEIVVVITGATGPSGAGNVALDDLSDVTITAAASGDILRHNGTAWVDTPGTTHFEAAGAVATHTAVTTNVHGIADTSALETTTGSSSKVSTHAALTSSVHGISAFGATLVDDADAATARTTLGVDYTTLDERTRDTIGTALTAGTGITITPNDGADTITVASSITQYTDEMARDALGSALVAGSNITITPNDGADTITIAASGGDITTSTVWAAKGDLIVATGNDAAAVLTVGANGTQPIADSNQTSGLKYVGAARSKTVAGTQVGYFLPDTFSTISSPTNQSGATAQQACWFPVFLPRRCTPTISLYVFTLESGATGRVSTWANDEATFKPATGGLIEDLGSVSASTTGTKVVTCSTPIGPGWVWIGTWVSNHTTVRWGRYGSSTVDARLMGDYGIFGGRPVFGWTAGTLDYSSAWSSTLPSLTAANTVTHANSVTPYLENV